MTKFSERILIGTHIMWYEHVIISTDFIPNMLKAIKTVEKDKHLLEFMFCVNMQTYIEKPSEDVSLRYIEEHILESIKLIKDQGVKVHVFIKRDNEDFYNIGDFRRELLRTIDYKYVVWGESDCLIPNDYFYTLISLNVEYPHLLSLSSRKMWDSSWKEVEFRDVANYSPFLENDSREHIPVDLRCETYSRDDVFDKYISQNEEILVTQLSQYKIDGAFLAISWGLDKLNLIPNDLHFVREDYCLQLSLIAGKSTIPQLHVINRFKLHNYTAPHKRLGTQATRDDSIFKTFSKQSELALQRHLKWLTTASLYHHPII